MIKQIKNIIYILTFLVNLVLGYLAGNSTIPDEIFFKSLFITIILYVSLYAANKLFQADINDY